MILALRTAGLTSSWHLLDPATGAPIKNYEWESGRSLADGLLGRLADSIREVDQEAMDARSAFGRLTGIIIFSGPGSFTSLRIGHTVASSLADGLGIPVVGAAGDDWIENGFKALESTQPGAAAMPVYGAEPNVKPPQA